MQVSPIASHAARILETRSVDDAQVFQAELSRAMTACETSAKSTDPERLDLLQTVVQHFQSLSTAGERPSSVKFEAGCLLLQNLLR